MKARIKIPCRELEQIKHDLHRPHAFALERIGFLTAGVTQTEPDELLLFARTYRPVADEDYVPNAAVGAMIGGAAMRKALQLAYHERSSLFHIHRHGGHGRPEFSGVDLDSGQQFVPAFFHTVSRMPHGMLVLSDDSATGLLWLEAEKQSAYVTEFVAVGADYRKFGRRE